MKKFLIGVLGLGMLLILVSCQQVKEKMEKVEPEKIEDVRGILDKVLAHIADHHPELSLDEGQLLDTELGIPRFETVDLSEINHFDDKDIVDGLIVRPVVEVENPHLLIVVEAVDQEASRNLNQAMVKVKSDQLKQFGDAGILTKKLVNEGKAVRQGNFLIYVTWEGAVDIVRVFERHVR